METTTQVKSRKKTARLAGLYYLFNVLLSIYYMQYLPGKIAVWDNPRATMENFLDNEMPFRLYILAGVAVHISFILLPLTLHKLLGHINKHYAMLMVVFALVSVPISFTILLDQYELISLFKDYASLDSTQQAAMDLHVLNSFESLYNSFFLCQTYWGLWLFPFGLLAFKSGFLPKFLGIALMLGCITYVLDIIGGTLFQNYYDFVDTNILILPAAIGEIGMCLWLLFSGPRKTSSFKINVL